MVMRLERPAFDEANLIDVVISERQKGVNKNYFNNIKEQWKQRVDDYVQLSGNPEVLMPWPEVASDKEKTRFLTLYNAPKEDSVQFPVLKKLRERTLQLCPACGEDGTPNTLDHYLPKNIFPEFSISTVNLFPMCDTCQGWKLEHTLDDNGARLFLHPYFDDFLNKQVIKLTIGEPYSAPTSMALHAHHDLEVNIQLLVARHLSNLEIETRYYHFFRDEYIRLICSANDIRAANLDMRQQLALFCNKARRKSINSWGHVFYESVMSNEDLLNYLEFAQLPAI
jgi:hypothetical protein